MKKDDAWKIRRRIVILTAICCCAGFVYLIGWGEDTQLNRDIAGDITYIFIVIMSGYLFGVVWDDENKRKIDAVKNK